MAKNTTVKEKQKTGKNSRFSSIVRKVLSFFCQSRQFSFQDYINEIQNPDTRLVPLSYDSTDFWIGREKEIDEISQFLATEERISFWVICGPGGSGKNKLVYSYFLTNHDWNYKFINRDCVEFFATLDNWDIEKDTCLIYDDVDLDSTILLEWFKKLFSCHYNGNGKLRFLLLSRGTSGDDIHNSYVDWFKGYAENSLTVSHLYQKKFMFLSAFSRMESLELVRQYFYYKVRRAITPQEMEYFKRIYGMEEESSKVFLPLFVLATVESYIQNPSDMLEEFGESSIYDVVYSRNCSRWKERISNPEAFSLLREMYVYATIRGEWHRHKDTLPSFLNNTVRDLSKIAMQEANTPYKKWFEILSDSPCGEDSLKKYSPDLLGEFFVIKEMKTMSLMRMEEWLSYIIHDNMATTFLCRVISDFGGDDCLGNFINIIILQLIRIMNTQEEHEAVAVITDRYLKLYPFEKSEEIRIELSKNSSKIKPFYCWTEVYLNHILVINEARSLHFFKLHYNEVMSFCKKWDICKATLLATKTLILLGELIRNCISEYSTKNQKDLDEYWNEYMQICSKADFEDWGVKEAFIVSASKIVESIQNASKKNVSNPKFVSILTELNDRLMDQISFFANATLDLTSSERSRIAYIGALTKLIESLDRILSSEYRSIYKGNSEWLKKLVICIDHSRENTIYWVGVSALTKIAISMCTTDKHTPDKGDITMIFSFIAKLRKRVQQQNDTNTYNYMFDTHVEKTVDRFFSTGQIKESMKSEARNAMIYI